MALTITDDHAAQESAFYGAPEWQRGASALRERLTEREIDATHPLVRFAGLDAYTAAGGGIRRDLFAEGDAGTYLTDATLLETLVRGKLDALAGDVRAEGWAWVEAVPHMSYAERQAFQNAPRQRREPSAREARRIASLQTRLDKIDTELEEAYDAEDEDKTEALEPRREQVAGELQAVEEALQGYAPDVRAVAGAIVTLDRSGEAVIHRGLLREGRSQALRTLERLRQGFGSAEGEAGNDDEGEDTEAAQGREPVRPAGAAVERAPHRRAANRSRPASASRAGRAGAWHGAERLAGQPLRPRLAAGREPESARPAGRHGPDWPESPAAVAQRELQQVAGEALPQDSAELFVALLAMEQGELVRLLAVCVAATVDVVTPRATAHQPGAELAQAVGLDMAAWWQPTADGYFQHVPKAAILEAVGEFAPSHAARLAKLKKADIASEAERLADGTGWMPAIFRTESPQQDAQAVAVDAGAEAPEEVAAVADELPQAEALAA